MKRAMAFALVLGLFCSPAFVASERAEAHPLHTSLAQLTIDPNTGVVDLSLRVFVNDYTRSAVAFEKKMGVTSKTSPLVEYAARVFMVVDARGHSIAFTSCGGKRVGDLMWLCFKGRTPGGALRVSSQVLFDTFTDQINIVQIRSGSRRANMLFTHGETFKSF